jgi:hypothetical protein
MQHQHRSIGRVARFVPAAALVVVAACGGGDSQDDATDVASNDPPVTDATMAPTTEGPTTTIATPDPIPAEPPEGMELVWSDEFDGDAIDLANWTYDIGGWGWGNGEAQFYTDRPENSRTQNGLLVIELREEQYEGSYYTSARLKTQGLQEFQYGHLEARIKVPSGSGTWPAFGRPRVGVRSAVLLHPQPRPRRNLGRQHRARPRVPAPVLRRLRAGVSGDLGRLNVSRPSCRNTTVAEREVWSVRT